MDLTDLKKKLMWFTLIFFALLLLISYLYCGCLPWLLLITLYVFLILYILFSYGGKIVLDQLQINPFAYLFFSFFSKVLFVLGFAYLLTTYFSMERKFIMLLLVVGYLIAATFDFILLANSQKHHNYEGKSK